MGSPPISLPSLARLFVYQLCRPPLPYTAAHWHVHRRVCPADHRPVRQPPGPGVPQRCLVLQVGRCAACVSDVCVCRIPWRYPWCVISASERHDPTLAAAVPPLLFRPAATTGGPPSCATRSPRWHPRSCCRFTTCVWGGGVGGAQQPPAAISVTTCEGKAPGAVAAPWRLTRSAWMRLPAALDAPVAAIAAFAMRASLIPIPVPPPCPRPNPPAPPQGLPARHGVLRGADGGAAREPVGAGPPLRRPLLLLVRARVQGMAPRPVHTSRESSNGGVPCTPAGHAPALTARDQLSEDGTCTLVAAAWRGPPPQPRPALGALPRSNRPLQGRL